MAQTLFWCRTDRLINTPPAVCLLPLFKLACVDTSGINSASRGVAGFAVLARHVHADGGAITALDFLVTRLRRRTPRWGTDSASTVSHQQRAAKVDYRSAPQGAQTSRGLPLHHRVNRARWSATVTRYNRCCSGKVNYSFFTSLRPHRLGFLDILLEFGSV